MTVADNTSRNQYTATSGQTVFAYTFEIVDKDDIVVLKNGTTLSEGTDYAVSGVGTDSGGNVTLTVGASTNDVLTLYRDMPYARTQSYTNSGDFLASDVNNDFDNLWLAGEQTNRSFEQSVRKPITDSDSVSMELPEASSRANKLLGFDATGAVSTSLVTDDAETIAGIAADIETLAHIQDGTVATDAITNVNTIRTDVTAVSGVASDVTAVAGNTTNINTVATDLTGADDIGTVAGSIANVDTVAGDIANVNSVAGNSTNINTVATDLAGDDDIGTVADGITYVKTTALNINDVTTTANNSSNISTVASNISNVNAVGGVSSDVTTVAGISTEVTAVSSNATNINTVGTNITNVNNVGSNIANVNTVAGLETEINAVVADEADIGVVGANITSVNTVSSNINSVNAVSNNMADVNNAAANATAAAASAADANTSAGAAATSANAASSSASNASSSESAALTSANNASQSAATASLNASAAATSATNASSSAANAATSESNADNSETAAAISASNASSSASTASNNAISAASSATSASNSASQAASSASAAATSATNSETAADTWNSYYSTYLGASATAPSYDLLGQPLQNGALYFNTTNDTMYVFNGSIWIAAESTINIVSVPTQLAADLTTNGNDIIFGDNDKAVFGAGSDLQIYHDASNSYIKEVGTGLLSIQTNGAEIAIQGRTGTEYMARFQQDGWAKLYYDNSPKLATTSTGVDVTGTVTADGLTVDGGITTLDSGSAGPLVLQRSGGTDANTLINFNQATEDWYLGANTSTQFVLARRLNADIDKALTVDSNGDVSFYESTGYTPKFFWDASAERLGLGTSSPSSKLQVMGGTSGLDQISLSSNLTNNNIKYAGIVMTNYGNTTTALLGGKAQNGTTSVYYGSSGSDHRGPQNHIFYTNASATATSGNTERMRIDSSGNVGIGESAPEAKLHVKNGSAGTFTASSSQVLIENNTTVRLSMVSPATNACSIEFGDVNDQNVGVITYDHASDFMKFGVNASEAMRLDSSGRLGLGTSSPATPLHISTNVQAVAQLESAHANGSYAIWAVGGTKFGDVGSNKGISGSGNTTDFMIASRSTYPLLLGTGSTERMRIDSSGNLLVGTTSTTPQTGDHGFVARANGYTIASMDDARVMLLNRATSDGEILNFRKDGTTVGSIGSFSGVVSYIALDPRTSGVNGAGLMGGSLSQTEGIIQPTNGAGAKDDDAINLGASNNRFKDIYATNGTIQTSDRNEKQDIEELSEAEQRVAVACKGLLRKFRWKSAVEEKGDDARIHFGIIAQDLQDAFTAEGLDAGRYAMFINSTWTDEETGEERLRMGVRYSELLAFIISAI